MLNNIHAFTPAGKIKRPSYSTVATWIKESWDEVSDDLIRRSFKCCGVSTKTDGSEDDCLFDYDSLLDQTNDMDDEVLTENFNNNEEYPEETDYENKWDIIKENDDEIDEIDDNSSEENDYDEEKGKNENKEENNDSDDSDDEETRQRLRDLRKKYKVKIFYINFIIGV